LRNAPGRDGDYFNHILKIWSLIFIFADTNARSQSAYEICISVPYAGACHGAATPVQRKKAAVCSYIAAFRCAAVRVGAHNTVRHLRIPARFFFDFNDFFAVIVATIAAYAVRHFQYVALRAFYQVQWF
jgi:hypothetical protein